MRTTNPVLVLPVLMLIGGCAIPLPGPEYQPPAGDPKDLATLRIKGLTLKKIDGAYMRDVRTVLLTPGPHEIEFEWTNKVWTLVSSLEHDFAAGKVYLLRTKDIPFDFKSIRVMLIDETTGRELFTTNLDEQLRQSGSH